LINPGKLESERVAPAALPSSVDRCICLISRANAWIRLPLTARIFAVVDVWDALCSNRPYRPAWSRERAYDYFRSEADKQFDPSVVQAFTRLVHLP
jgi:hypothetical protein